MSLKKPADFSYSKHKGIPLEDIELDETYSISINYDKQPDKIDRPSIYKYYRQIYDAMYKHKESIDIILFLESSPTGRLHFHGYLNIKDYIGYIEFLNDLKVVCSFEIDTIDDHETWYNYCSKQAVIWRAYLDKHIVGYPLEVNQDKTINPNPEVHYNGL